MRTFYRKAPEPLLRMPGRPFMSTDVGFLRTIMFFTRSFAQYSHLTVTTCHFSAISSPKTTSLKTANLNSRISMNIFKATQLFPIEIARLFGHRLQIQAFSAQFQHRLTRLISSLINTQSSPVLLTLYNL